MSRLGHPGRDKRAQKDVLALNQGAEEAVISLGKGRAGIPAEPRGERRFRAEEPKASPVSCQGRGERRPFRHRRRWHRCHPCSKRRTSDCHEDTFVRHGDTRSVKRNCQVGKGYRRRFPHSASGLRIRHSLLRRDRINENLPRRAMHRRSRLRFGVGFCKRNKCRDAEIDGFFQRISQSPPRGAGPGQIIHPFGDAGVFACFAGCCSTGAYPSTHA